VENFIHLGRFRDRILTVFSDLVYLNHTLDVLAEISDQYNVDQVANALSKVNLSVDVMKNTIESLIKEIAGVESEEIDVQVTQDGNIL